jgi:hypothetical protein
MSQRVDVTMGRNRHAGILSVPSVPAGLVIFAHGSGSSRLGVRNRHAADLLGQLGFATLLFDLLTEAEGNDRRNVFDISLLAAGVVEAIDWAGADPGTLSFLSASSERAPAPRRRLSRPPHGPRRSRRSFCAAADPTLQARRSTTFALQR